MWWLSQLFQSGSKVNCHLTADSQGELERAAERLRAKIHGKGNQRPHLDLNQHQRELAIRYGAAQTPEAQAHTRPQPPLDAVGSGVP